MPSRQRRRVKRRTFAKLRNKRKKESSELIDTIDGNPIFTEDDIEDDRITRLLQQRQSSNYDDDEKDIFLTDLLDIDSNDDDNENDIEHKQMLEDIFSSQSIKEPTIMGSQLNADPLDIQTNAADLQSLMRHKKNKKISMDLSQQLDALDDVILQNERVTMDQMISTLNVPIAKSARKQITLFDENQELERLKLAAQTKINNFHLVRKERGLQMDKTRKEMQSWSQAVRNKTEMLKNKRNMIPPKNNMMSFMENMEWNGDLGKELQCILDDYSKENDLDSTLQRHKPSRQEIVKQAKKMSDMRRQIANQIKQFKRIKKIKSRSFRKRMRARKAKVEPSLEELQELDPRLYKREVNKLIRQRAEERMTLRHKNSSKWAINILRRGKKGKIDLKSRKALMEQLERGKALKRKIQGRNSDSDDSDDDINPNSSDQNAKNDKTEFESEVESERKKKEKYISDAKEKGIWNMKFMKEAEDKRRAEIRALTDSAEHAKNFHELDDLERKVNRVERSAYHINPLVNSFDDPIGAIRHSRWLSKQKYTKEKEINKAQTILGKRKYGLHNDKNDNSNEPDMKKLKHRILDMGNKAKIIKDTQHIEETVFGKGTKSIIRVDIENEDENENRLKEKELSEPVFEMIEFPKHNDKKMSISEINEIASEKVNKKDIIDGFKFNKKVKVKTQRYYVDNSEEKDEIEVGNDMGDGWSVILKGNESVHNVKFGILPMGNIQLQYNKQDKSDNDIEMKEDLNGFLDESDDNESECENGDGNEIIVQSILKKKDSKYESVGKNSNSDKHVKFGKNEYSDGNPKTKFHTHKKQNGGECVESNPWLSKLGNKKSSKQKILLVGQKETTQFDAKKMLIPETLRKSPDFNLLETNDPKQIDIIYKSLQSDGNGKLIPNDTTEQEFSKLKDSIIDKAMPNKFEGALKGWNHWTGPGIENDMAYKDDEYLQAKALYEKKKNKLLENRSDNGLAHVILSDEISKASGKYVMKWQPDWVNISAYNAKMKDTIGREWNLATEYFHTIKPDYDIPTGYIISPTQKHDGEDNRMFYKTKFGKKNKDGLEKGKSNQIKLHSIYKGDVMSNKSNNGNDDRPDKDRA